VAEPDTPGKGCGSYADPQGTGEAATRWPLVQDAARIRPARSFDCPPQGGGEGPEEEPKIDAEAVSKGEGEPDETMPEPKEPAGTKPGLQVLPGTKNGSPGGRQTQSMTDALLWIDDTEVGKSKSSVVMPKGFEELPRTDPQYQGTQGFNFGDFPPLGGGVSKDTTSNVTEGAGEAPSEDMEIVKQPEEEVELGSMTAPNPKGKAKEHTAAVEGVPHIPASVLPAEAPPVPAQQINRPTPFRGPRFSSEDMAQGEGSLKRRVTPMKSKPVVAPLQDDPENDWPDAVKAKYQQAGVQMVLGGKVTQNVRKMVKRVLESEFCEDVTLEQGLVNYIFRGQYNQGLDSQFFMNCRQSGPAVYPTWADVWTQEGLNWTPQERLERQARAAVSPGQADFDSLAVGTELTEEELQQFARGQVVIAGYVSAFPIDPPLLANWLPKHKQAHQVRKEYRLTLLRYVVTLARTIIEGNCKLVATDYKQHRLLVEFYWMLHKIPDFLLKTNADECAESCCF
jgi:hypothetical protein